MAHEESRPLTPLIRDAIRGWYRSLADHDLGDVRGHLQGLGVLVILLAKLAPSTRPALTNSEDDFGRKLEAWKEALAELLAVDLRNGGNGQP